MPNAPSRALLLFAHGSSRVAWREPLDELRRAVQAEANPATIIRLAFLERCSPTLADAMAEVVAAGVQEVAILPLFISAGGHVQRDLPPLLAEVRATYPAVTIQLHPAIGAHPAIVAAIAGVADN